VRRSASDRTDPQKNQRISRVTMTPVDVLNLGQRHSNWRLGHGQTQSQLHGGDKFSFLNSGSKPSERHSFNSLICAGDGSTDRVFVCFVLLTLRLSVLTLT